MLRRDLESLRHRERILCERRRLVDVDALQDLIDRVRGDRAALRAERRVLEVHLSREIRDVFDAAAVVPAVLHVVVLQRAADVLHRAIRLNGREDLTVAELIAEDHRHAARHAGAERSAGDHAEARLADRVERERRVIVLDRELVAASEGRRTDPRDSSSRGCASPAAAAAARPPTRPTATSPASPTVCDGVESANLVALIVERREQHPARLARHRERRRDRRDAAHARRDGRDAEDLAARQVQAIDVREAVLVGDEEEVLAVRRELRIDVLALARTARTR